MAEDFWSDVLSSYGNLLSNATGGYSDVIGQGVAQAAGSVDYGNNFAPTPDYSQTVPGVISGGSTYGQMPQQEQGPAVQNGYGDQQSVPDAYQGVKGGSIMSSMPMQPGPNMNYGSSLGPEEGVMKGYSATGQKIPTGTMTIGGGGKQQWAAPAQQGGVRQLGSVIGAGYGNGPQMAAASMANSSRGGGGSSFSESGTQMVPGMVDVYKQLLGINQDRYKNVMNEYQGAKSNMAATLPGIYSGYDSLKGDVMNTLGMGQVLGKDGNWGVADPAAKAISDTFQQQNANTTQQMTSAGLGNTTAVGNAQNQNAIQAGRSYGALGAQLADKAAGYQSQIGMGGLGARMQGLGMQTNFTGGALDNLGQQASNTAGSLTGQFSKSGSGSGSGSGGGGGAGGAGGMTAQDAARKYFSNKYSTSFMSVNGGDEASTPFGYRYGDPNGGQGETLSSMAKKEGWQVDDLGKIYGAPKGMNIQGLSG